MHEEQRPFQQVNSIILIVLIIGFGYYVFFEEPADGKLGAVQRLAQNSVSYVAGTVSEPFSEPEYAPEEPERAIEPYKPTSPVRTASQSPSVPVQAKTAPTIASEPVYDASKAAAIFDQAELAHAMYQKCSERLVEYNSKVHLVRDQGTLYQWDGNVNNCLEEYIGRSQTLAEMIRQDAKHVSQQDLQYIRTITLQSSQNLRQLSTQYSQLSATRHQYIHHTYQTNSLIDLGILIGETAGAISAGDAPSAIGSLSDLYGWWYYNGGVIDTGWGQ